MGHYFATVALGPILLLQGRAARRRTPRLPEPPGARKGTSGTGAPLNLLIVGDSAAAGVGAAHQDEALLGRMVEALAPHRKVFWTLHAKTGATTAATLESLGELEGLRFEAIVTSLGVNDVTAGVGLRQWLDQQSALRSSLRSRFGASLIVVCGLPPVHGFPALPQPLRWYLGRRARQFDSELQKSVASDRRARFLSLQFVDDPSLMASDGYHPGPQIYDGWGRLAADVILGTGPI